MAGHSHIAIAALTFGSLLFPASNSAAGCLMWETQCTNECIEYYPNGTDCKKTKKHCERVCVNDTYDVNRGGVDDANRGFRPQSFTPSSERLVHPGPTIIVYGRLERLMIDGLEVWIILPREVTGPNLGIYGGYEIAPGATSIASFEDQSVEVSGKFFWSANNDGGIGQRLSVESIRRSAEKSR